MIIEHFDSNGNPMDEYEYLGAFMKSKKGKIPHDIRLLVRDVQTGAETLWYLREMEGFFGRPMSYILSPVTDVLPSHYVTPDHLKTHANYNYYRVDNDPKHVHDFLALCKSGDPMVPMQHLGPGVQMFVSDIKGYPGRYRFDNTTY